MSWPGVKTTTTNKQTSLDIQHCYSTSRTSSKTLISLISMEITPATGLTILLHHREGSKHQRAVRVQSPYKGRLYSQMAGSEWDSRRWCY